MSSYAGIVAVEEQLEIPSKAVPAACERKLASAERRLRGAIAREVPRAQLVADAERVRRAHLGVVKARIQAAAFPAELEDVQGEKALDWVRERNAGRGWREASVDEIIARYAAKQRG